ncbi:MAG: hypothetical protein A3D96_07165 [Chlamydiae bacterium RIFCSPHIGHO2_12_FULL_44_59]|nr:MAG: hypothetical protein A2796_06175 [Chlamydiae bacterium RIFCSPHIGHO2_01_FULL_44_39]OGN58420.1 MAG: hypothetical protein A3C42_00555 [Chlamydiae bacterium RIFCSPHIGHO2_02_FULL_45_9]OGN59461.1 MAG: hypothetical protein A3D96_07165 [Chlamydiae bacterium RIFCSPHIGHO2_12_FULL_44_59]OGN67214.1 MAG: hypothetical protein A2978_03550 [Chlamydiae bacterium RIFCSPLOWO2_01_FULL_44_52]OGN67411.1 MAG: hypothetical protein A3I67_01120 [Chlamydiae bacterium RIFCSPLOWO2_02_FULL_45_22]OGN69143.1 MAG: hyp
MYINPIKAKGVTSQPKVATPFVASAAKVAKGIHIPKGASKGEFKGRMWTPLTQAKKLAQEIQKHWNQWDLEHTASQIIELEDRVLAIQGTSSQIEKIKKIQQRLHFQFVHPGATELFDNDREETMPPSFLQTIQDIMQRVLRSHSLAPFQELTLNQQREVFRIVEEGK